MHSQIEEQRHNLYIFYKVLAKGAENLLRFRPGLVVFELDVEAVLNADLHLNGVVELRVGGERVHNQLELLDHVGQPPDDSDAQEVA